MLSRFGDAAIMMGFFIPRVLKIISLVCFTAVAVRAITGVMLGTSERISWI
jgi:hypothetical protein